MMILADLPHLTVTEIESDCAAVRYDPSPWVGEGWIAGIHQAGSCFIWGRFRAVDAATRVCLFYPDEVVELSALKPAARYPYFDGYWGERAELVMKDCARWQKTRFEATDMIRFPVEGGGSMAMRSSHEASGEGETVPGGWDHEHCAVCWNKIGCGGEAIGYFDPPGSWVCEECYVNFVEPRSLAFIVM